MRLSTALVLPALLLSAPLAAQAPAAKAYLATSDSSRAVGEQYIRAYVALDWDAIESMLADSASFQDPTAQIIFGGRLVSGKAAMLAFFRENYAGLTMSFVESRSFFSGHYAVIEGELTWSAPLQNGGRVTSKDGAFVLILRIEGGKVVEHRDYTTYKPFIDAMQAMR